MTESLNNNMIQHSHIKFIAIICLIISFFSTCKSHIIGCPDPEYSITILSQNVTFQTNNSNQYMQINFNARNDGDHDYDKLDFSFIVNTGVASESFTIAVVPTDMLSIGNEIVVEYKLYNSDFSTITNLSNVTSVKLKDVWLYNIEEDSDVLYIYEFSGHQTELWSK